MNVQDNRSLLDLLYQPLLFVWVSWWVLLWFEQAEHLVASRYIHSWNFQTTSSEQSIPTKEEQLKNGPYFTDGTSVRNC